jgi:hypothetical protein
MRKLAVLPFAVAALVLVGGSAYADCGCCDPLRTADGWCDSCEVGYVTGVRITSKKLFDAVAGEKVDAEAMKCSACAKAVEQDGACDHCGVAFAAGKAYKSKVGQRLALGKAADRNKLICSMCRQNSRDHGWCDSCKVGLVGNRAFKDKKAYTHAAAARKVLLIAAMKAEKCSACAVAMVDDGTCDKCEVSFKDGRKVSDKSKDDK